MASPLAPLLARALGLPQGEGERALAEVVELIRQRAAAEGAVHLDGLGTFRQSGGGLQFEPAEPLAHAVNHRYAGLPAVPAPGSAWRPPAPAPPAEASPQAEPVPQVEDVPQAEDVPLAEGPRQEEPEAEDEYVSGAAGLEPPPDTTEDEMAGAFVRVEPGEPEDAIAWHVPTPDDAPREDAEALPSDALGAMGGGTRTFLDSGLDEAEPSEALSDQGRPLAEPSRQEPGDPSEAEPSGAHATPPGEETPAPAAFEDWTLPLGEEDGDAERRPWEPPAVEEAPAPEASEPVASEGPEASESQEPDEPSEAEGPAPFEEELLLPDLLAVDVSPGTPRPDPANSDEIEALLQGVWTPRTGPDGGDHPLGPLPPEIMEDADFDVVEGPRPSDRVEPAPPPPPPPALPPAPPASPRADRPPAVAATAASPAPPEEEAPRRRRRPWLPFALGAAALLAVALAILLWPSPRPTLTLPPPAAEQQPAPAPEAPPEEAPFPEAPPPDDPLAAAPEEPPAPDTPLRSADGVAPARGGYTWVVASEATRPEAERTAERYRQEGYRASVLSATVRGRTTFRVAVGQFPTAADADRARNQLPPFAPADAWRLAL